jgi:ABC-type antimicrobial peptide transport system permease subunit
MAEQDPRLPLARVRTMEQLVADSMARTRFTMLLLLIAAVTTLFLSAVGTYGVISYAVSRRRHEIGVRMALGARTAQVHRMVLRQGTTVAVAGLAFGIPAALALTRFLRALLFEVSPTDPTIFVAMSVVLLAVALLATYLPARRATRVNPVEALRHD